MLDRPKEAYKPKTSSIRPSISTEHRLVTARQTQTDTGPQHSVARVKTRLLYQSSDFHRRYSRTDSHKLPWHYLHRTARSRVRRTDHLHMQRCTDKVERCQTIKGTHTSCSFSLPRTQPGNAQHRLNIGSSPSSAFVKKVKIKVARTRLPSVGFRS